MKHAILVIAHHNCEHILKEMDKYDDDFRFFIHWDKRKPLSDEYKHRLLANGKVAYLGEEYAVNWASYGIVRATLLLCRKAMEYGNIDYCHLVSDSDLTVRSCNAIKRFFEKNDGKNFLQHFTLSRTSEGIYKMKYFHRMDKYDIRANKEDDKKYREELDKQKHDGIERKLPECELYWGSAWWSLRHDCVEYLLSQTDFIERYYIDTIFPDEHFAQTVIMNSRFAPTVENTNLRYISWIFKNGNRPAVIDRSDLTAIISGNYFFARKTEMQISKQLIEAVDKIVFSHYVNVRELDYKTDNIVEKILGNQTDSHYGIMYGNAGALVFLSLCLRMGLVHDMVDEETVRRLQEMVLHEYESADDESYATGRCGLLCALAYSYSILPYMGQSDIMDEIEETADSFVDMVLNSCSSMTHEKKREGYALLKTTALCCKTDDIYLTAIDILGDCGTMAKEGFTVSIANVGLRGLSGLGLWMMTEKYGVKTEEWEWFFPEENAVNTN